MGLSGADSKLLESFFGQARGNLTETTRDTVVAYFTDLGAPLSSLPLTVEKNDSWKDQWRDHAVDAGLKGEAGKNSLWRFITAVNDDSKAAETIGQTRVQAVISAVKDGGLGGLEARVTRALRVAEAGDEHTQSQDPRTISIIYLAELPGDEWLEWYGAQKEGVEGGAGSDLSALGITQLPTIDLRKSERYVKVHKDASCTSLQRALADKTGYKLTTYCQLVAQLLNGNGLALAGNRWHRIKSKIESLWLHIRGTGF